MTASLQRAPRRLLASVYALCLVASLVLGLSPQVQAQEPPAPQSGGMAKFGACLAGQGHGSLVLLMDQSGSLTSTDPDKSRVVSAKYLAERLNDFSKRTGFTLDVRVAGFADVYNPQGQWASLNDSSMPQVAEAITNVGDAIKDYDTDYWTALEGARQDLADHAQDGCQAVIWFSDGAFDLDVREGSAAQEQVGDTKPYAPGASLTSEAGVAAAEKKGAEDLCRATGLADQLRSSGITLIGVGLSTGGADFGLMHRVVSGGGDYAARNGVVACGDVSEPEGAFYQVSDIDSLLLAFDLVSAPGTQVSQSNALICQGVVCQEGETSFVLDSTLQDVHILATADVEGLEVHVMPPGASTAVTLPSTTKGPQTQQGIRSEWLTGKTLQIDLSAQDISSWDGQWRLTFVDKQGGSQGRQAHINTHLSSPLTLSWQNLADTPLRQGETVDGAQIALLERAGGAVVDSSRIKGSVSYSVSLFDAQGQQHKLLESSDLSQLQQPLSLQIGPDVPLGAATLTTSVTVTTAAVTVGGQSIEGTTLAPTLSSVPVTVNPPLDFPVLAKQADFGLLEEQVSASTELAVTGPGCVWLEPDDVVLTGAPAEAGTIKISSTASNQDNCVSVEEGATAALPLTLSVSDHANGALTGALKVSVAPKDHPERAQQIEVPFTADMRRPLDVGTAWTAFVLVLLAGIVLPLAALYLFRFLAGRIRPGLLTSGVKVVEVPGPGQGASISFALPELETRSVRKPVRELQVAGYRLRVHLGWSPTSLPEVRLVEPKVPSVSGVLVGARNGCARLPLEIRGHWVAVADQPDSPSRVSLLVLAADSDPQTIGAITADAAERLGRTVAESFPAAPQASTGPDVGAGGAANPFAPAGGGPVPDGGTAGNPFAAQPGSFSPFAPGPGGGGSPNPFGPVGGQQL